TNWNQRQKHQNSLHFETSDPSRNQGKARLRQPWLSSLPRKVYQVRLSKVVKDSDFGLSGLSDPPLA
ncbi:hypothetical protein, partial [Streptococcus suis]|uniref:hypothetical protein n=1 Tax=Streptococcus suis TaxID=1307 RepID=UPI003F8F9D41